MRKYLYTNPEILTAIARIAREHDLMLVILYGSVAWRRENALSDTDIGVLGSKPLTYEKEAIIGEAISRITGDSHVEIKSLHHVSPLFLLTVMRSGIILFEDRPFRAAAMKLYAWKLAAETRPLRLEKYRAVRRRLVRM